MTRSNVTVFQNKLSHNITSQFYMVFYMPIIHSCIGCLSTLGLKSGRVNDMLSILGIMRCESNTKIVTATAVERRPSTNANTITNHETGHQ